MSKKSLAIALIFFVAGILVAPIAVQATQRVFDETGIVEQDGELRWSGGRIIRFDDSEFQVKCWAIDGDRKAGISCLPWNQVKER